MANRQELGVAIKMVDKQNNEEKKINEKMPYFTWKKALEKLLVNEKIAIVLNRLTR